MSHRRAGISRIEIVLPKETRTVEQLHADGLVTSDPADLRRFGFRRVHVSSEPADALALLALHRLVAQGVEAESIDHLFVAGALPRPQPRSRNPLSLFGYPATRLQVETGMRRAGVTALDQAGCAGLFSAVHLGNALFASDRRINRIAVVGSDVLPARSRREILYNVISDAACALLLERDSPRNRVLAQVQSTKGFYWTPKERERELIASYFPTARRVIEEALANAGASAGDIALVLPHNVNRRSWDVLLDLAGIDPRRFYGKNIGRHGHTIAADPFLNLVDAEREGRIHPGDKLLLFTFGFGAHWACLVLEH